MSKTIGATVGIPPRNRKININPFYIKSYYKDDPYITTFWNCLSLLFPQGEQFFADSVKAYRGNVSNKQLLAEISGFIGQESFHTREHERINEYIAASGINVKSFDKQLAFVLGIARKLPPSFQLAATCALEHYTGIMGHQLLDNDDHNGSIMYDYMQLWIWHAIEECEHKCVSFDVYQDQVDSYLIRIMIMLAATVVFFSVVGFFYFRMLFQYRLLNPFRIMKANVYLGWLFKDLIFDYLEYFKPGFHPSDQNSKWLINHWLKMLNIE